MALHYVALPHTKVAPNFSWCAYTSKTLKWARALGGAYEIFVYAPEGPSIPGATLVPCLTNKKRISLFGRDDPNKLPDWPTDEQSSTFHKNVIHQMRARLKPQDLILLSGGLTNLPVVATFGATHIIAENSVGYEGVIAGNVHASYESASHLQRVYALRGIQDQRYFDCVIPNLFDPEEFPRQNSGQEKDLLFFGRGIHRKGPHIAAEIARATGRKLLVAGAGMRQAGSNLIMCQDGTRIEGDVEYVGPVNIEERAKLLSSVYAVLLPTTYAEPFGGIFAEANFCGTPAITSDFGSFTENITPGVNGFRFRTLQDAVNAVDNCAKLTPSTIHKHALAKFSLPAVADLYSKWYAQLGTLFGQGWYQL